MKFQLLESFFLWVCSQDYFKVDKSLTVSIMIRFCVIFIVLISVQCSQVSARKYYVSSSNGNDNNNGFSVSSAWKTISKVNKMTFSPGDSIFFKRGDFWRETLIVPSSGKERNFIVFSSYGSGAKPQILGSVQAIIWIRQGDNLWKSSTKTANPRSGNFKADIYFVGTNGTINFGSYKADLVDLNSEYQWTWLSNNIYIYSSVDPTLKFKNIEVPQRQQCIDLNNMQFLELDGFDLFYSQWSGISYDWSFDMLDLRGLVVENCKIAYVGSKDLTSGYGTEMVYSDMIFRSDTIHDCGRRSVSLDIYGSGFTAKNVVIEKCVFYNGYHTTGIDLSVGSGNYNGSFDGVYIRNNLFYDNPKSSLAKTSNLIFLQNNDTEGGGATLNNIFIYSNIFKYPNYSGIMLERINDCHIYNNTFFNNNSNIISGSRGHIFVNESCTNISIKNNIFYSSLPSDASGAGIELFAYNTDNSEIDSDNNLYYRLNNNLRIIFTDGKGYYMNQLNKIQSVLGWEKHSPIPADPLFISNSDLHLTERSPAIGKGIQVNVGRGGNSKPLARDFDGNLFNNPPSIGAYERNPALTPSPSP